MNIILISWTSFFDKFDELKNKLEELDQFKGEFDEFNDLDELGVLMTWMSPRINSIS